MSQHRYPLVTLLSIVACSDATATDDEVGDTGTETETETETDTETETETETDTETETETETDTETGETGADMSCIDEQYVGGFSIGPQYKDMDVVIGSHCKGTNNQDITGIQRVVFLGDSITVNSPPTSADDGYRAILAEQLSEHFDIPPPDGLWNSYNLIDGVGGVQESGAFAQCAKWGARTDDLESQIADCFTEQDLLKRTLVIWTMGGNDMNSITTDGLEGATLPALWEEVDQFIQFQRDAVHWFVDDPDKFPAGVFVVFANIYEFTDGTADLMSCDAADLVGYTSNWDDPLPRLQMMATANHEFAKVMEETQTDQVFLFETFCGHGFHAADPSTFCFRGANTPILFDLSCIHPNPEGHAVVADLFFSTITE